MFVRADWRPTARVLAGFTTRHQGTSCGSFASANLADHVGDDTASVKSNRGLLERAVGLRRFSWLHQVHGTTTVEADENHVPDADAQWTTERDLVLAVLTADCVPVLLTDHASSIVAAIHCGWRGLAAGVIASTLEALPVQNQNITAWLGPAICQKCYEVQLDVVDALQWCLTSQLVKRGRESEGFFLDLPGAVQTALSREGVSNVLTSGLCTHHDARFFSYRRDGLTGRTASLIALT